MPFKNRFYKYILF